MRCNWIVLLLAACAVGATAAVATAYTPADLYVHYALDETSGTVLDDSGPNDIDATFYRTLKYGDLPGIDASNVSTTGPTSFGNALGLGARSVGGVNHEVLVDLPASTNLPGAGDSFAVSFWASTDSWANTYGMLASYNLNGLEWSIGLHSSYDSLVAWTGDAPTTGTSYAWQADCSTLTPSAFAHFVVQFEGTAGITGVYVNGAASTDAGDANFWGNEREGFTLGGRVLDARGYTVPAYDTRIDDFAIINGVVDSADVVNLMGSGAGDGSFDGRRLAHYAMEEVTGTQLLDSSANANHGTILGYDSTTMGLAAREVSTASRTGAIDNCIEFASGLAIEHADMDAEITNMPGAGEAFTVCFWMKPDENMADLYGWDQPGMICSWSNDIEGLGLSVAQNYQSLDGSMIVRRTTGDYTSSADQDVYGVYLGNGDATHPGLQLDPHEFHHFAITVAANGDITAMYVDGEYAESLYANGFGVTDEDTGILGGRIKSGTLDTGLCAYIDDLAVIAGELPEAQIERIMTLGVAGAAVPEPSTFVLLLGAMFATLLIRRARG
ncbi:MAG: PEP-CTERM sorting domain-containing protein [Pirellulales bacterium]|nr:PEP-CTERM sorting domain-containing protein [Pirellulales bacterium]